MTIFFIIVICVVVGLLVGWMIKSQHARDEELANDVFAKRVRGREGECDEKEESALYVLDREENTTETILEGNYKWINLAGGYCFFFEFSTERAYAYDYTKKVLSYFNPPTK